MEREDGDNMIEIITKYWVQWVCGLGATGIVIWAKHIIKLEKNSVKIIKEQKMKEMRTEIVEELENKIEEVRQVSNEADKRMQEEINQVKIGITNLNAGVLSLQSKQFREECVYLLQKDHFITIDEYEQFEEDYAAYKNLGGNHNGDALHSRVVEKFASQVANIPGQ